MFSFLGTEEQAKPAETELMTIEAEQASDAALMKAEEAVPATAVVSAVTSQPDAQPAAGDPKWNPEDVKCCCCGMTKCCKGLPQEPMKCCTTATMVTAMLIGLVVLVLSFVPINNIGGQSIVGIAYHMVRWGFQLGSEYGDFGTILLLMGFGTFGILCFGALNSFICMTCPLCCCSSETGFRCCAKTFLTNSIFVFLSVCIFMGGWGQVKSILEEYSDDTETHDIVDSIALVVCLVAFVLLILQCTSVTLFCKAARWPSFKPQSEKMCC